MPTLLPSSGKTNVVGSDGFLLRILLRKILSASGDNVTVCGVPFLVSLMSHSPRFRFTSAHCIVSTLAHLAPVNRDNRM